MKKIFRKIWVLGVIFLSLLPIPGNLLLAEDMPEKLPEIAMPIPLSTEAESPSIAITEIAAFEASGYEWIEVFNNGEAPIDLSEISFFEDETAHALKVAQGDPVLLPQAYAVIAQDAEKFLQKYPDFSGQLFDSSWGSLKEDGEEIGLKDKDKNTIELFTYLPIKQSSLKRKEIIADFTAQNWTEENEPSPGKENFPAAMMATVPEENPPSPPPPPVAPPPVAQNPPLSEEKPKPPPSSAASVLSVAAKIHLSEINFQHPSQDWIEIYMEDDGNNGKGTEISGFSIHDTDKKRYEFPAGTFLKTNDYLVIPIAEGLSGGTQILVLKNAQQEAVSATCWSASKPSQKGVAAIQELFVQNLWHSPDSASCARSDEIKKGWSIAVEEKASLRSAGWKIFQHPTPGTSNVFRNSWPQAIISIQSGIAANEAPLTINVTGETSYDPDGDDLKFFWNFGDGTTEITQNPSFHTYASVGNYIISLQVEDSFGALATTNLQITVLPKIVREADTNPAPVANPDSKANEKALKKMKEEIDEVENKLKNELKDFEKKLKTLEKSSAKLEERLEKEIQKNQDLKSEMKSFEKTFTKMFALSLKKLLATKTKIKSSTVVSSTKKSRNTTKKRGRTYHSNGDLSNAIMINEIYPIPNGDDDEWIELFNPTTEDIRLGNWFLDDREGGSKPFRFGDEVIPGNGFLVINKKQSKIFLNNAHDEVRLLDFRGNLIDSVSYQNGKAGQAYARFEKESQPLVASLPSVQLSPAFAGLASLSPAWDWTSDKSPDEANPSYQLLHGMVKSFMPETKTVILTGADGLDYEVEFDDEMFHPVLAPLALEEGTETTLKVKSREDGTYELRDVEEVKSAASKKTFSPLLFVIGAIILAMVFHGIIVIKSLLPAGKAWLEKFRKK